MYIPYCRYIKNNISRILNVQEDKGDYFAKCTILVGNPVTFLFTGCRSLSGPFRKSMLFFSSQEQLPSTQKRFVFLTCLLQVSFVFFSSLKCVLCFTSRTKQYSLSLTITVKPSSVSLNFIVTFLTWGWQGRDERCTLIAEYMWWHGDFLCCSLCPTMILIFLFIFS